MKKFWKSKTLWTNVVAIGLEVGKKVGFDIPTVPAEAVLLINIVLRLITTKGVTL